MAAGEHLPSESPLDSSGLPLGKCSPSIISIGRPEHHPHQVDFRLAGARKRSEHHRHRVDSRLTPKEASIIIGVSRAAACKTAQASSASSRLSLARCPPPGKRASSASAALLLPKLPEHHLHQAHIRLAGGPPPQRSQHQRHQLGVFFYKCRIIGISWAASCLPIGSSRAASCTSAEHHLHQVDSRLAGASPPPPRSLPPQVSPQRSEACPITCIRWTFVWQVPAKEASIIGISWATSSTDATRKASIVCIGWTLAWQLPRPKKRASSASAGLLLVKLPRHHLYQVDSRLPGAPFRQASNIGISRAASCKTAHRQQQGCIFQRCRASSASSGLSLGRLLCEQVSEVHSTINSRLNTRSLQHNQDSRPSGSEVPAAKLKLKLCSPNLQQPCHDFARIPPRERACRDCCEIHTMHPESTARCLCAVWCMARPKLAKKQHVNNRNRNLKTWKAEQRQGDI